MRRRYIVTAVVMCVLIAGAMGRLRHANDSRLSHGATVRVFVLNAPPSGPALQVAVLDGPGGHLVRATTIQRRPSAPLSGPPGAGLDTLEVDQRHGRVFVTELDSAILHAFDAASGRLLWTVALGPPPQGTNNRPILRSPVVDEQTSRLFVANFRTGTISTLLTSSGRLVHTIHVPPGGIDMVAVHKTGRVFVFHSGQVNVLDAVSGQLLRTGVIGQVYDFGPAVVDQRTGRVFLANGRTNSVSVLDGHTGRLVRTVPVGPHPTLPIIDARTGQVRVWSIGPISPKGTTGAGSTSVLDGRSGALLRTLPGDARALSSNQQNGAACTGSGLVAPSDPWRWIPTGLRQHLPFLPLPRPVMSFSCTLSLLLR